MMPSSAATAAARAFVAVRLPGARALGASLADEIDDPVTFVTVAGAALAELADPAYLAGQRLVAPGIGPTLGVRTPLLRAVLSGLRRAARGVRAARLLPVAEALARDEVRELRWMAIEVLRWILPHEPEQAWQVLRRLGREADDWITVDTLAGAAGAGVVGEPYRWAELDQLVYSPSRWERRLVASTVATIPRIDPQAGRSASVVEHGLELVGRLIGDAEPEVSSALAWALRVLGSVDPAPVAAFCRAEVGRAVETGDGNRARVLRDAARALPPADAAALRACLAGVRRRKNAPSTSSASATAAAFVAGSAFVAGAGEVPPRGPNDPNDPTTTSAADRHRRPHA